MKLTDVANPQCDLCHGEGEVTVYCTVRPNFKIFCVKCFPWKWKDKM